MGALRVSLSGWIPAYAGMAKGASQADSRYPDGFPPASNGRAPHRPVKLAADTQMHSSLSGNDGKAPLAADTQCPREGPFVGSQIHGSEVSPDRWETQTDPLAAKRQGAFLSLVSA